MSSLTLNDSALQTLVAPHVPIVRRTEIAAMLASVHAQFAAELAAGQPELERDLRAWTTLHLRDDLVQRTVQLAEKVRAEFNTFVHVGIGGSDLGPRVAQEVLGETFHNELTDEERKAPRIYFAGDTFDPRPLKDLLDLIEARGDMPRTAFNIVSKSGKTPETLCALLSIKERLEKVRPDWTRQVILTTGERPGDSILFDYAQTVGPDTFLGILPVPEGVGGRFSQPCPVGLLPLAVTASPESPAQRLEQAMAGYAEGHRRMLLAPDDGQNIAFRLAGWLQQAEEQLGLGSLVLYDYSACRMLGDWLVQLYTESIQERGGGLNIISGRGPTSNHSLLNGIVGGPRDKVVLFLRWEDLGEDVDVPVDAGLGKGLEVFMGRSMKSLQEASLQGTIADFARNGVPSMVLSIPRRDPANLFLVMRVLMDMVAVKGRLQGLHIGADSQVNFPNELTYLQAGVEGYKQAMRNYLKDN